MLTAEIIDALKSAVGSRAKITFDDGVIQAVDISSIDEEGFVHSGPNGDNPRGFWTRFTSVTLVEPGA